LRHFIAVIIQNLIVHIVEVAVFEVYGRKGFAVGQYAIVASGSQ
jgi:hypothetical protein